MKQDKITKVIIVLCFLLVITLSFFPTIEPFYTITNTDQYAHEFSTSISSENGEYSWQRYYELSPGETIEVRKPLSLVIRWINPFRETDIFYSSSDYEYYISSEGKKVYISVQPAISTCFFFELKNESGEYEIDMGRTHY
ncbi:MAG: hypothetical protein PWQ51_1402 [Methanolobus sp.]|uniref:hypothetical protein n=1 Tax=Methanolobus sp. TaxID=1874737 RepID=UPI0024AA7C15|nr:hypothetical protein [Methanolobus sp.]MDI3487122.1 hypothetical protein [Methanolobus sp.]MDK2831656.1 hypothetical protein [Methanolobus sp.]MDK2939238.1 hypothetical protein [Methanolobus sp.]